jgi:GntR family transcriptional regulator
VLSAEHIDFSSPVPYYAQLLEILSGRIARSVYPPGAQLPGEPELCRLFGVSRTVVRQALGEMEQKGLIERRKGKGTFAAPPKISESLAQRLTGFHADMLARGYHPVTAVLHQRVVEAGERVAHLLEIPAGARVLDIKRLRSVEDLPVQLVTSYLPYALCPRLAEVDLTNRSLYDFLEGECGLVIARGRRTIEAVPAGEADARLLGVERGAALIRLESLSFLADGRPLEYYEALHRGDRSRFEIELVRLREGEDPAGRLRAIGADLPESNPILSPHPGRKHHGG